MSATFFDENKRGNRRLWQVFWIEGVVVSHVLFAGLLAIYGAAPAWALVAAAAVFLLYTAWIMHQVWINAFNVDREVFAPIARALTVAWAMNAVLVCAFLAIGRFAGQPLPFY
jgi:hypothetical protein